MLSKKSDASTIKQSPYRFDKSGIYEGSEQLTTFRAKILQEVEIHENGSCVGRVVKLEKRVGDGNSSQFEVNANDFDKPEWVVQYIGILAQVCLVPFKRFVQAIIALSEKGKVTIRRYCSMGFQTIDGRPAYVHGGGALAGSGTTLSNVESGASETFPGYGFPDGSTDPKIRAGYLKAPPELLRLSEENPAIGAVLFGSAVRAVLSEFHPCTVTPILIGETGAGKSELLGMETSFFRPGTELATLPFNMTSTARGLRLAAQASSHTVFPIDDYYPTKGKSSDDDDFIEMLIHGGSSTARRVTAKSASDMDTGQPIQTLAMITAEVALVTDKASRHARALYCELGRDDVDAEIRLVCLGHAKDGNFARAMGEFVVACLDRHEEFKQSVPKRFEHYRAKAEKELPGLHRRHWLNAADIMLGCHYYLVFCLTEKVIEKEEYRRLIRKSWNAIVGLMKEQDALVQRYSTNGGVNRAFEQLLRNGKYHLQQFETKDCPKGVSAERVGWIDGQAQGEFLGYADADKELVYVPTGIDTLKLYDALPLDARGLLDRGPKLFWKRVTEHGLLVSAEAGRNGKKVPGFGSGRFYVLSIPRLFR